MKAKLLSRVGIEVWKNIPEFESYQVSNLGNVRSLNYNRTKQTKNLKLKINSRGRRAVNLSKNGISKDNCKVHQLVSMAFLNHKPCGQKIVVDHIDNDKLNDRLYNLQLITSRENCSKDRKNGTSKYTGVCWSKRQKKWQSAIRINGKIKHLGIFTNEIEAAQAYQNELKKL
jgi:hypothetical protein